MVKTKVLNKPSHERKTSYVSEPKKGDKKIIEKNLFEAKPLKKGEYRTEPYDDMKGEDQPKRNLKEGLNNGWWQGMQDGETCRTFDEKKIYAAVGMSISENKGINIQGIPEQGGYAWYMTRILTSIEATKPIKKTSKKGNKK